MREKKTHFETVFLDGYVNQIGYSAYYWHHEMVIKIEHFVKDYSCFITSKILQNVNSKKKLNSAFQEHPTLLERWNIKRASVNYKANA